VKQVSSETNPLEINDRLLSQCEMAELLGITERSQQRFEQVLFAKIRAELAKRGFTAEDAEALLGAMQELGDETRDPPHSL